jgi:hypothetical protein
MTFEELSEAINEDLNGQVVSVARDVAGSAVIMFECDDWEQGSRRRRFDLVFENVLELTASPSYLCGLHGTSDHPLLWNYNDDNSTLYFSSSPANPFELVGELYESHSRLLQGWRPLSDYLHANSALMCQGYGQFAAGPRRVIDEYARILGDRCRWSIIRGHTPTGGCRVVLLDRRYVVCRHVSVVEREL